MERLTNEFLRNKYDNINTRNATLIDSVPYIGSTENCWPFRRPETETNQISYKDWLFRANFIFYVKKYFPVYFPQFFFFALYMYPIIIKSNNHNNIFLLLFL